MSYTLNRNQEHRRKRTGYRSRFAPESQIQIASPKASPQSGGEYIPYLIQQLHTYGLLHASFRPDEQICVLRSLVRQREMLLHDRASHIQHMQKSLQQMNLKLTNVLTNIAGTTGLRIIRDIVAGVRDPQQLAKHRDHRCGKSEVEISKSLVGDYRSEHVFALQQALELYEVYTEKLKACDAQFEQQFAQCTPQVNVAEQPLPLPTRRPSNPVKNHPG